jgi:hypothetical protein
VSDAIHFSEGFQAVPPTLKPERESNPRAWLRQLVFALIQLSDSHEIRTHIEHFAVTTVMTSQPGCPAQLGCPEVITIKTDAENECAFQRSCAAISSLLGSRSRYC